jgi:hypothetical protein
MVARYPAEPARPVVLLEEGHGRWRHPPPPAVPRFEGFTREQVEGRWPAHTRTLFTIAAALGAWTALLMLALGVLGWLVPALLP